MTNIAAHPGFRKKATVTPKEEVGPKPQAKKTSSTKKKKAASKKKPTS